MSDRVPCTTTTPTINNNTDTTTDNTNNEIITQTPEPNNVAIKNEATTAITTTTNTETNNAITSTGLNASIVQALIPNVQDQLQKHTQQLQQLQEQQDVNAICNQIAQQQQQQTQLLQNIEAIPDHLLKSVNNNKSDSNNDSTTDNNSASVAVATTIDPGMIPPGTAAQQQQIMPFEQTLTNAIPSSAPALKTGVMTEAFMASLPLQASAAHINNVLNINSTIEQEEAIAAAKSATATTSSYGENRWTKNGFGDGGETIGGKFSPMESELVQQAIKEYCASKNTTPAKLCFESDHRTPDLKGAWMEIAKKLPHRTVQSVYRHGLRQLHPFKRGAWSEEECKKLHELVTVNGKKWSLIQKEVHRSADSCRDKYREMSFTKGRWTDEELKTLVNIVREEVRCPAPPPPQPPTTEQSSSSTTTPNIPNIIQIHDLIEFVENNDISIPWSNISKKITTRSRLSCFKKWQKIVKQCKDGNAFVVGQAPKVIVEDKRLQFSQLPPPPSASATSTNGITTASDAVPMIQLPPLELQQLQQQLQQQSSSQKQQSNGDIGGYMQAQQNTITPAMTKDEEMIEQYDRNLLEILSSSNTHIYPTDIQWNTIPRPPQAPNPQTRWIELMGSETYNMHQLPIFQLAKFILDKKIRKDKEAEAAAASVVLETMQLPSTKDLLDHMQKVTNDVSNNNSNSGEDNNNILPSTSNIDTVNNENNLNKKRKVDDISNISTDAGVTDV